jgi:heme/copper-type cytochrome/quinol oxidase subunit 2
MDIIRTLMFFTIGAALVVAVALFVNFLRRRRNRQAAKDALLD